MITNTRYIDVNFDLKRNNFTNDVSKSTDLNAIQQSIMNLLLTNPGEKPFDDNFGAGIYNLLFETISDYDVPEIASEIESQINFYEPRATFVNLQLDQNDFTLNVKVDYTVSTYSSGQPPLQSINLSLTKVR